MKTVECEWCEKETPKHRLSNGDFSAWSIVSNDTFKHLYWLCNACHSYSTGVNTLEATLTE